MRVGGRVVKNARSSKEGKEEGDMMKGGILIEIENRLQ